MPAPAAHRLQIWVSAKGRGLFAFAKRLIDEFIDDDCPRMAAALAYYSMFSLPAMLGLLLWGAHAFSAHAMQTGLVSSIGQALGPSGGSVVRTMAELARFEASGGIISTVLSFGILLYGATRGFAELQEALNRAWEVEPPPHRSLALNFLLQRALSFVALLGVFFLVALSLLLEAGLNLVERLLPVLSSGSGQVIQLTLRLVGISVSFALLALTFALLYRVVPDAKVAWRDALAGAVFTTVLFNIGRWAFGLYLSKGDVATPYGAAGAFAAVLLWVYYFAIILLLGAEFTQIWSRFRGRQILPARGAVRRDLRRPDPGGERTVDRAMGGSGHYHARHE